MILRLKAKTIAKIPCSICNELVTVPIEVDVSHAEPLEEILSIFPFGPLLREDIFLQLPKFAECQNNCPERKNIQKFLKTPASPARSESEGGSQFPFAGL